MTAVVVFCSLWMLVLAWLARWERTASLADAHPGALDIAAEQAWAENRPPTAHMSSDRRREPRHRAGRAGGKSIGKDRAFDLMFRRPKMFAIVWAWLKRLRVPPWARDDVTQDVFLQALRSWPSYDPKRARPERWLNQIAVHVASHYREQARHWREKAFTSKIETAIDEQPATDELMDAEKRRLDVWAALESLEPELRSILVDHDMAESPMVEVAAQRGLPLSTAYKWRARALRAFVDELKRRQPEDESYLT